MVGEMNRGPSLTLSWQPPCICPTSELCACGAKRDVQADIRDDVSQCFQEHRTAVYRYLVHLGCGGPDAQDVAQEAFLRLYRERLDGVRIIRPLAWVLAVARRIAMDHFRRQKLEARLFDELGPNVSELPDTPDYEDDRDERRLRAALVQALQALNSREREILTLRVQGHSLHAIGQIVDLPVYAVSRAIQRTIRHLQRYVDDRT